jgi:Arc/MetJ-type ribon-helix-helix transcriptional regulator
MKTVQVNSSIPKILSDQIDILVDGVKFRSRSHFIHCAITTLAQIESEKSKGQTKFNFNKKSKKKQG